MQMSPRHEVSPHDALTGTPVLAVALCAADGSAERSALCFALGDADAAADLTTPQWRELIPAPNAQGRVQGIDGRWWRMSNPQGVVDAYQRPLAVDINHASELQAPQGGASPATGWIEKLEVRQGAVWGLIAWNAKGQQAVGGKEYRFLSPVFKYDGTTREIKVLTSAALTNEPNFPIALNRANDSQETPPVDEAIRKALGLPEKATAEQAVTAINALQRSVDTPSLEKFVPRADYDAAQQRATNAEARLADHAKATKAAEIDAAVEAAVKAGKITPATVEYHKASCAAEGGLERFKAFVEAAPVVADTTNLDGKQPGGGERAMNAAAKTMAAMFGNSAEDIKKYGQEEKA
ncbi:phage protease [Dyella lutea]|uniref:Phage protease n=1 Tax=Dyella lutea TaxID=2950441 RepID=A0ABT1FDC8_9GAMM|nr:phage protease [Dyella lutea]MCP1375383.1 phage protease [Dyella lutea]